MKRKSESSSTESAKKARLEEMLDTAAASNGSDDEESNADSDLNVDSLFDELQLFAIESAVEKRDNVFITGKAGVGKSRCVAEIVRRACENNLLVALTATTGIAAQSLAELVMDCNVVPTTVHSFAGLSINDYDPTTLAMKIKQSPYLTYRWEKTDMWIIDEVSMLSPVLFVLLDKVARIVRGFKDRPFGGITMVFVGDFFQLPPVMINEREIELANGAKYCFMTSNWIAAVDVSVVLQTVYRQGTDTRLIDILNQVRHGKLDQWASNILRGRTFSVLMDELIRLDGKDPVTEPDCEVDVTALKEKLQAQNIELPPHLMPLLSNVEPTKLVSKNALVDAANSDRLSMLSGETMVYCAHVDCNGKDVKSAAHANMLKSDMRKNTTVPDKLELKLGAQVMLLVNRSDSLVNGSRGIIVAFLESSKQKKSKKKLRHFAEADSETKALIAGVAEDDRPKWPLVLFDNGERVLIEPHVWSKVSKKPQWEVTRSQVPLKLAWAISIHKSQGLSISNLCINFRDTFSSGQSYVALSRARSLNGLMLDDFDDWMIIGQTQQPDKKVIRYYELLETQQNMR